MVWHSSPHSASNAMTYTLREAAQQLGIDLKTLRKKMDLLGIVPVPDARDRRALLITDEQIEQLARHLNLTRRPAAEFSTGERSLESMLIDVVKARERDLDLRSAALDERERALAQQIDKLAAIISALDVDLRPRIAGAIEAGAVGTSLLARQELRPSQRLAPDDHAQTHDDEEPGNGAHRNGTSRAGAYR